MVTPAESNVLAADPRNYQLPGKVSLWFRAKGKTEESDWKEFGNLVNPAIAGVFDSLDHWSQRRGQSAKDRTETTARGATLNFSIDEINRDNLLASFGQKNDPEASTIEMRDGKNVTNPGAGETIDLGVTNITADSVVVKATAPDCTDVVYEVDTDYEVDEATGIITILGYGALADPDDVPEIHVQWSVLANSCKFEGFPGDSLDGEAQFQVLTTGGTKYAIKFGNVVIKNNGDITLGDGTAWQEVPLQLEALVDENDVLFEVHIVPPGILPSTP
jgi:hypothetical protein